MLNLLESPWDDLTHPVVVLIEDSDEDFYTFLRIAGKLCKEEKIPAPYNLLRFEDGDEALDYLLREGEYESLDAALPAAILLDLNLPGTDGREIIKSIKQTPKLRMLPIVVLTTSRSPHDIQSCYEYGANSYILKPMGISEMQETVKVLFKYWFQLTLLPSYGQF
ncbi:MAG: response regulator [Limnospira sp.]